MSTVFQLLRLGAAAAALAFGVAQAQDLPPAAKQMRIVVPYSAGGTSDILGRMLAKELGDRLGRQVIVENRGGGSGGSIGTDEVVRSDPDGSTILLHSGAVAVDLTHRLPYDVQRDLASVTTAVIGPFALLVSNALPVKTVPELIAYAKARPGKLNFGTPGIGTSVHLTTELFKTEAGIDIVNVPYKGASKSLMALMANEVQIVIDPLATAKKYAQAGKMRALAVTTAKRTDLWPEMPTLDESGLKGFDAGVWYGIYVPAKTPRATVKRLNAEFVAILTSPTMRAWLSEHGMEPVADSPEAADKRLGVEIKRWRGVIKAAHIKAD
jgi:tripartite-type tricarboxylate transporter receptor subunit TctC